MQNLLQNERISGVYTLRKAHILDGLGLKDAALESFEVGTKTATLTGEERRIGMQEVKQRLLAKRSVAEIMADPQRAVKTQAEVFYTERVIKPLSTRDIWLMQAHELMRMSCLNLPLWCSVR